MNRRNFNRLSIENLERRELMAADAFVAGGVLPDFALEMNEQVVVSQVDSGIQVSGKNVTAAKSLSGQSNELPVDNAARDAAFGELGGLDFQKNEVEAKNQNTSQTDPLQSKSSWINGLSGTDLGSGRILGVSGMDLESGRILGLSGTDLGSGRIKGLSGTDLGSGR